MLLLKVVKFINYQKYEMAMPKNPLNHEVVII